LKSLVCAVVRERLDTTRYNFGPSMKDRLFFTSVPIANTLGVSTINEMYYVRVMCLNGGFTTEEYWHRRVSSSELLKCYGLGSFFNSKKVG
jgi:hypothetical protein